MMRIARSITPSQVEMEVNSVMNFKQKNIIDSALANAKFRFSSQEFQYPYLTEVKSFLFIGSLEGAYCEPLLCRNRIECLVDVSGQHPNKVNRNRKSSCPCTCPLTTAHSRAKLTVVIETNDKEEIVPYFEEINKFIHYHRLQRRNVLVFSNNGTNRAPTVVTQYLMQMEHESLSMALTQLKSLRPNISLSKNFLKILKMLNRKKEKHIANSSETEWLLENGKQSSNLSRRSVILAWS